jgi:broad specificity phosphatase PhoE
VRGARVEVKKNENVRDSSIRISHSSSMKLARRMTPLLLPMRHLRLLAAAAFLALPAALHAQATTVILVRHAEKSTATPGDADPVLSDAGQARALALREALADAGVQAVVVTPLKRTRLTATPLLEQRGLQPQAVAVGATHVADVAKAVREHKGKTVLVVGHSNTIPAIVGALGGPKMPDLCDAQYAQLYTLVIPEQGTPTLVRAQYGAPDAPTAGDCARTMRQ